MLCEDLAHATEQLNMLTEASKKHSELLQSAQEEMSRKEALIQELQHEVRSGASAPWPGKQKGGPSQALRRASCAAGSERCSCFRGS